MTLRFMFWYISFDFIHCILSTNLANTQHTGTIATLFKLLIHDRLMNHIFITVCLMSQQSQEANSVG